FDGSGGRVDGLCANLIFPGGRDPCGSGLMTPWKDRGPHSASSRRDFLPLLGEREEVRADVSVHLTSTSGPPPRSGIKSPEAAAWPSDQYVNSRRRRSSGEVSRRDARFGGTLLP